MFTKIDEEKAYFFSSKLPLTDIEEGSREEGQARAEGRGRGRRKRGERERRGGERRAEREGG